MPRRTWLDSKIDVFVEELAVSGMHLDRHRAGELITGQVRAVATLMRVTGVTARGYLGDETIKDMARRMLFPGRLANGPAPTWPVTRMVQDPERPGDLVPWLSMIFGR